MIAKGRLKELLAEKGLAGQDTDAPAAGEYLPKNGEAIGKKMLQEGFARTWSPMQRNDWCG